MPRAAGSSAGQGVVQWAAASALQGVGCAVCVVLCSLLKCSPLGER